MSLLDKMWESRGAFVPLKIRRAVHAVHQGMGIESSSFAEDLAYDLARELKCLDREWRKPNEDRIQELLEANNREVERRRVAERSIEAIRKWAIEATVESYIDVILASTGFANKSIY